MPITRIFSISNSADEEIAVVTLTAETVEIGDGEDKIELFAPGMEYAGIFYLPSRAKIREVGK